MLIDVVDECGKSDDGKSDITFSDINKNTNSISLNDTTITNGTVVVGEDDENSYSMNPIVYDVRCGLLSGKLHFNLFTCPGIHRHCIEFEGKLITPREFTIRAEKDKQKDWKGSIRLGKTLMESKTLDFYQHETNCSLKCQSRNYIKNRKTEAAESLAMFEAIIANENNNGSTQNQIFDTTGLSDDCGEPSVSRKGSSILEDYVAQSIQALNNSNNAMLKYDNYKIDQDLTGNFHCAQTNSPTNSSSTTTSASNKQQSQQLSLGSGLLLNLSSDSIPGLKHETVCNNNNTLGNIKNTSIRTPITTQQNTNCTQPTFNEVQLALFQALIEQQALNTPPQTQPINDNFFGNLSMLHSLVPNSNINQKTKLSVNNNNNSNNDLATLLSTLNNNASNTCLDPLAGLHTTQLQSTPQQQQTRNSSLSCVIPQLPNSESPISAKPIPEDFQKLMQTSPVQFWCKIRDLGQFNDVIDILTDKINQLKNLYLNGDAKTEEYAAQTLSAVVTVLGVSPNIIGQIEKNYLQATYERNLIAKNLQELQRKTELENHRLENAKRKSMVFNEIFKNDHSDLKKARF